ncbi:pyridine nucleotide-disulfide oxidoreductase-domain-containing protein [Lyophyllum atratum]|nr:pyridine nucleotide-disulfide oxidoreductase-domain-containing protein [Lyophyllum atratum]
MQLNRKATRILARSLTQSRPSPRAPHPGRRLLTRTLVSDPPKATVQTPEVTEPPAAVYHKQSKWRSFLQIMGRTTLITILAGAGTFYYITQRDRSPGAQLPFDESKKTLVILGSGWGATSLLKAIDTTEYNVVVISPKNFFLFTPLLPSVAAGTLSPRSIIQSTRYVTRHKKRSVSVIEAEAQVIDPISKTVTFEDTSPIRGSISATTIPYDYLVMAVGAEVQTFGIPGVQEYSCFMKELADAERMQKQFMDCLESAAFPGQSEEEIERLLHMVVVGGGPTGIELSGEIHDFLEDDLKFWYPELAGKIKISLVEALPSVLPTFSKQLIEFTESTFKESKIDILTKTMVKEVKEKSVVLQMPDKSMKEVPCGMVVWAGGNKLRKVTHDLMNKLPAEQTNRRGIEVDDYLRMKGADGIFAIGDCSATSYAPTAQVASQEGAYLARMLVQMAKKDVLDEKLHTLESELAVATDEAAKKHLADDIDVTQKQMAKVKLRPFHYSHQGSLAYIGSEKAIADLPFMNGNIASGGVATYLFWRSAYLSTLFSLRNRTLVATDWLKVKLFGRDVARE